MRVHLSEGWEPFVRSLVASGRFASERAVVDEALGLLEARERGPAIGAPKPIGSPPEAPGSSERPSGPTRKPIWEAIEGLSATVPEEAWDTVPTDLAAQHDHYLYGTPKRTDS